MSGAAQRAGGSSDGEIRFRRALLLTVVAALVSAVLAGLARLGVPVPWGAGAAMQHGPLFVLGVFVTVISLERAVALGAVWSYAAPVLGAAHTIGLLAGVRSAAWLAVAASVALVAVNVAIVRRQSVLFTWGMALGSVLLAVGTGFWASGAPVWQVVPSWLGFFVLTIVAERLELSRFVPTPSWAPPVLAALSVVFSVTMVAPLWGGAAPGWPAGVALAGIGVWQLAFDLARRTVRTAGVPRHAAIGILAGSGWLVVAGAILVARPLPAAGPTYDAATHAVFVGYVLSMVFAHAPIILPAVARLRVRYSNLLLVPLVLLHAGLVVRMVGDALPSLSVRQAGGLANSAAIVLFGLGMARAVWQGRRRG